MSEWREARLEDLCERVTVGFVGKMSDQYLDDGVPFLRSQNIKPFRVDQAGMLHIGEKFHQHLKKSELQEGDVAVVRTGYPGTAAVIPAVLHGSNCADLVVITPSRELNPHFLAAIFNSTWGRAHVGGQLVGSAQQHFNVGSAKSMLLRLPNRAEQDQIAEVLCSITDLIENNRRRIEALEVMSQAIYREWFVNFRYPGHANANVVDSPLGPLPEGWQVVQLRQLAQVNTASRKPSDDEVLRYLDISCVAERSLATPPELNGKDAPGRARRKVRSGDIVWSMVRPNRRAHALLVDPGPDWLASTGLAVITPHAASSAFVFESVSSDAFSDYLVSQEGGSAYPAVKPKDFENALIANPGPTLDADFAAAVAPMHSQAWALRITSDRLGALRDLLLPKLVTGELAVSALNLDALVGAV